MTPLESAARAMCRSVENSTVTADDPEPWRRVGFETLDAWVDATWRNYLPQAIAAFEAIREPSRAMVDVGCRANLETTNDVWKAMVDEMLKEGSMTLVQRVSQGLMSAQSQWEKENSRVGGELPWTEGHLEVLARAALSAARDSTDAALGEDRP